MPGDEANLDSLLEGALRADSASVAKLLTRLEDSRAQALPEQRALLSALEAKTAAQHSVAGLTGPPGAGKSTLAAALIRHWLAKGHSTGMVAVDPSSPVSGGALLGDRARMRFKPEDRVFVRSMAARGKLGGLAPATRAAVLVLRAVYDHTLIETVGVGQSEIDIASVADTVVLVLQPGSGDTLQFMKAGILEIPDVLVVHKWDLGAAAARTRGDLESILSTRSRARGGWTLPVLAVSSHSGEGVDDLASALEAHHTHLEVSGEGVRRHAASRVAWALELLSERYGTLGLERLGGAENARAMCEECPGTALDAFAELATRTGLA